LQLLRDELASERKKMEDANGYLKRLYEDKINQLEQAVKDANG
jgi:hypothetical protein